MLLEELLLVKVLEVDERDGTRCMQSLRRILERPAIIRTVGIGGWLLILLLRLRGRRRRRWSDVSRACHGGYNTLILRGNSGVHVCSSDVAVAVRIGGRKQVAMIPVVLSKWETAIRLSLLMTCGRLNGAGRSRRAVA